MSAGSRKKHNSAHKSFGAGSSDHLEVAALIAGADAPAVFGENTKDATYFPRQIGVEETPSLPQAEQAPSLDQLANAAGVEVSPTGRVARAFLSPEALDAAIKAPKPELDLNYAGPPGYVPDHVSAPHGGQYVSEDVQACIVRVGSKLEGELGNLIVAIIELHAEHISGLRTGFTVSQYTTTQVRALPTESRAAIHLTEKYGRPVDRTMHSWADRYNDYQVDNEKKKPASEPKIQLEDVTIDVLFIEPDPTGTLVNTAWLGRNLYPAYYSGIDSSKMEPGLNHSTHGIHFDLAGQYSRNKSVDTQAQTKLDALKNAPWAEQEA